MTGYVAGIESSIGALAYLTSYVNDFINEYDKQGNDELLKYNTKLWWKCEDGEEITVYLLNPLFNTSLAIYNIGKFFEENLKLISNIALSIIYSLGVVLTVGQSDSCNKLAADRLICTLENTGRLLLRGSFTQVHIIIAIGGLVAPLFTSLKNVIEFQENSLTSLKI